LWTSAGYQKEGLKENRRKIAGTSHPELGGYTGFIDYQ
jgi:hypothetical protein